MQPWSLWLTFPAVDKEIGSDDMLLLDMGCEYYAYDSDITCSIPANGRFSEDQAMIYEAVLAAHQAVIAALKPGISWPVSCTLKLSLTCSLPVFLHSAILLSLLLPFLS